MPSLRTSLSGTTLGSDTETVRGNPNASTSSLVSSSTLASPRVHISHGVLANDPNLQLDASNTSSSLTDISDTVTDRFAEFLTRSRSPVGSGLSTTRNEMPTNASSSRLARAPVPRHASASSASRRYNRFQRVEDDIPEVPRSPSPEFIMANSMTMMEFVQYIRQNNIRLPDPKWDEPSASTAVDYVTKHNPRLAIEIDRQLGGRFLAYLRDRLFPIACVEDNVRRMITKAAMTVSWVAPYEYYKDFIKASSARNPPKPNVALLTVNKQIGEDAALYLYACNTFFFKNPDYFIITMGQVGVTNLLRMEFSTSFVLADPFGMIMRSFEADWLVKNLRVLKGVMIGDLSDEWDVAWKEYNRFAKEEDPAVFMAEDRFASDSQVARAMKAFGRIGRPEMVRPLDTLLKSKECLFQVFGDEYFTMFGFQVNANAMTMSDDEEDFVEGDSDDSEEEEEEEESTEEESSEESEWGSEGERDGESVGDMSSEDEEKAGEKAVEDPFLEEEVQDDGSSAWETETNESTYLA